MTQIPTPLEPRLRLARRHGPPALPEARGRARARRLQVARSPAGSRRPTATRGATAVVTASTGNHGAATAWAADRLGLTAVVYAPEGATQAKLALVEELGAETRLVGADLDEAKEAARGYAADAGPPVLRGRRRGPPVRRLRRDRRRAPRPARRAARGRRRPGRERRPPRRRRHAVGGASARHDPDRGRGEGSSCDGRMLAGRNGGHQ